MRRIFVALSVAASLHATTLNELFDALKQHSVTKVDEMQVQNAKVAKETVRSKLYPKIDLFAKYDHYSDPTGMVPVPPNTLFPMIQDQSIAQPFSRNVLREGASFSMPLFVKSIYTLGEKAEAMHKSAEAKKKINLIKNEALIVGANANLLYLTQLEKSLSTKERSLRETQKTLKIKVENGRTPESALYKIDDALNQINITKNAIALQKEQVVSSIRTLTGITLKEPVKMPEASVAINTQKVRSLEPLELKLQAQLREMQAKKERLYPSVVAYGNYSFSQAKAYNNDKHVHEKYGNIGVVFNLPLFAMDDYKEIQKAKVEYKKEEIQLQKQKDELLSKAQMLQNSLPLLENSIKLSKKSIENKKRLLEIAKVNYNSGRLSTEEYLRYEDEQVSAKAALYKAKAQKWQTLMQLCVIYGNNIEEIIQ